MDQETRVIVERVAQEAAHEAVTATLTSLGVDAQDPLEAQRDFAALRELRTLVESKETQADLMHLRKWRLAMEQVQTKGILAVVGVIISAGLALLWVGLRQKIGS